MNHLQCLTVVSCLAEAFLQATVPDELDLVTEKNDLLHYCVPSFINSIYILQTVILTVGQMHPVSAQYNVGIGSNYQRGNQ